MVGTLPPTLRAPPITRRLGALLYEGILLFGVLMAAGLLYAGLTQQRHALQGRTGLQAFMFVVLAIYFVWFWTHGGQTVAMKTWHVRVVRADGQPLGQVRALVRYLSSWLWFLPSLAAVHLADLQGGMATGVTVVAGALAYAASSRLHPQRQFLHDVLAGTCLVDVPRGAAGPGNSP